MKRFLLSPVLAAVLVVLNGTSVQANSHDDNHFERCMADLSQRAIERGYDQSLVAETLGKAQPLPRVISLDKKQPEFSQSFANYLYGRVNQWRIDKGRQLYRQYQPLLDQLTHRYGVPGQYIIAFWGLETNYGGYLGYTSLIDALATLACDARRSAYFSEELLQSVALMQRYNIPKSKMQGSWAGAMGNTQFMPSNYMRYGIDGDGDGRVDLWESIPDALTSAANFLHKLGWHRGERWGREVQLPDGFNYVLASGKADYSVDEWRQLGVRMADGGDLPKSDLKGRLLLPASASGPAFLLYENFDIIMKWNRSEFYALSVGHLSDRIVGGGDLVRPPSASAVVKTRIIKKLQQVLTDQGYDTRGVDGVMGPSTRAAISAYQSDHQMIADGFPSLELIQRLNIE